jgi:anti-sigma B factor antagonist
MPEPAKSVFLVDPQVDPVLVCITGKASFANSAGLKDFFTEMLRLGKTRFIVDFHSCTGMDSTFLGVLAGTALELRRRPAAASLTLTRVGERNLELIRNLGLHRLATVDGGPARTELNCGGQALDPKAKSEIDSARLVLEAHENLVAADPANAAKFQDVLTFLRNRVESK